MPVQPWVQSLVEDVIGPSSLRIGGRYIHPVDGPIEITSGQYWGEDGISNFWCWKLLASGEEKHGYGGHWPRVEGDDALA